MSHKKVGWLVGIFVVLNLIAINPTLADEKEEFESFSGFSYQIEFPSNQIGEKQGALSLLMTAGQKQSIPVTLSNLGKTDITLNINISGARTNSNGLIEYGPTQLLKDDSLAYDFPDLASFPKEVTIPASDQVTVNLDLSMPEVAYKGIVLGGVQIMLKDKEEKAPSDKMVVNKFARLFGVTLRMSDVEVKPDLALKQIYPGLKNYLSVIHLDIGNVTATKIQDLTTEVEIQHKKNSLITYNSRKNNIEMAPNSLMNYYISLDGEPMIAGDYTANVKVFNNSDKWEWTKDFTITDKEANKFNKDNMGLVQERKLEWKTIIIGTIIGVLVLACLYLIIVLIRKNKSKSIKQTKKRKRDK